MSCDLHEIGSSAYLAKKLDVELPDGKKFILKVGEVGIIREIDKSKHMVDVYFKIIDMTLTLHADEVLPMKEPVGV